MGRIAPATEGVHVRAFRWLRLHPTAAAALVYLVLCLVLYAPGLVPGHTLSASDYLWSSAPWDAERPASVPFLGSNYELVDAATQSQQWMEYSRHRLFDPPLWNPQVGLGRPFLGNGQSAVFSPFSLPAYVLPFWWSLGIVCLLKIFTAAFGTYLLGRALGMRFAGALLAGLVFAFSLYFLVWVSWPLPNVWAWLPWLLLLTDRVIRDPRLLPALGLAGVVAVQFFGGHPESNFHVLATTVVFFAFRLVVLRRAGEVGALRPRLLAFAGGLVLGAALAAVVMLPFLELLARSGDVDVRSGFWQISLPRKYLLGFALYEYWGRPTHVAVGGDFSQVRALYVGALPLALGAAALVVRPTLQRLGVALFGAALLAIVLGVWPFPEIAQHIPVARTGNSLRASVILMLCLGLLAGWGLDDLLEGRASRRNVVLGIALALLAAPALVLAARGELSAGLLGRAMKIAWGFAWPTPPADADTITAIRMASLIVWLSFMGAACALLFARLRWRLGAVLFAVLALALVAGDLFKAGMGATPAITTAQATQPSTPGLRFLESRRPNRFVGIERALGPSPIVPNAAMRWSLYDARAWDPPVEKRYDTLWRRAILDGGPTDVPTTSARLTATALPAFRLLSVTDVAQDPADPPVRDPSLPRVYDARDLRVYATPRPLPRAGVVAAQRVVPGDDAQLDAVLDPSFDGRRAVVTAAPLPGLRSTPGRTPAGSARITSYKPERVAVDATASRASELVLTDLHYPGWKVTLDGKPADLHRVDYLLRGTSLPPGRHRVVFSYEPSSFRLGWIISLIAVVVALGAVALAVRRRRA
jgi:Bacterial membrane protein YfhO